MGTRRSKHNKGRKPEYKDHGRAEAVRASRRRLQEMGLQNVGMLRHPDHHIVQKPEWSPKSFVRRPLVAKKKEENEALSPVVLAYLAERKKNEVPKDLRDLHERFDGKCCYCGIETKFGPGAFPEKATRTLHIPLSKGGGLEEENVVLACYNCNQHKGNAILSKDARFVRPGRIYAPSFEWAKPKLRAEDVVSKNDVLIQLVAKKSISWAQFNAGRTWQLWMHVATLQPSRCVDWSEPVSKAYRYQKRGSVSDSQADAVAHRNGFAAIAGKRFKEALDFVLSEGRGASALTRAMRLPYSEMAEAVSCLLQILCDHLLGYLSKGSLSCLRVLRQNALDAVAKSCIPSNEPTSKDAQTRNAGTTSRQRPIAFCVSTRNRLNGTKPFSSFAPKVLAVTQSVSASA